MKTIAGRGPAAAGDTTLALRTTPSLAVMSTNRMELAAAAGRTPGFGTNEPTANTTESRRVNSATRRIFM